MTVNPTRPPPSGSAVLTPVRNALSGPSAKPKYEKMVGNITEVQRTTSLHLWPHGRSTTTQTRCCLQQQRTAKGCWGQRAQTQGMASQAIVSWLL